MAYSSASDFRESERSQKFASTLKRRENQILLVGLAFTLAILSPPADAITDQNLTLHMFQHIGLFFGGGVVGYGIHKILISNILALKTRSYPLWKVFTNMIKVNSRTKGLISVVAIPVVVFTYWHIPSNFDLAANNESVHFLEHLSYLVSGGLVGMSVNVISRKWKAILLFFAFMHVGMMGSIWIVWPDFFPLYTYAQNLQMDTALMLFGALGVTATGSWMLKLLDII